jgi:hypothetical protein
MIRARARSKISTKANFLLVKTKNLAKIVAREVALLAKMRDAMRIVISIRDTTKNLKRVTKVIVETI